MTDLEIAEAMHARAESVADRGNWFHKCAIRVSQRKRLAVDLCVALGWYKTIVMQGDLLHTELPCEACDWFTRYAKSQNT